MRSSFSLPPAPVDSIVTNESSSEKPVTVLLHSANLPTSSPHHHHLYNYWTLNERLRARNEKLSKRQQSSCRLAFYSMWLFILAGVMAIVIYRFIDDCSLTDINRKHFLLKCSRHVLFLVALCVSFLACSGVMFGACRYFRSQPQPYLHNNEYELHVTPNYDVLPTINTSHSCFCQTALANGPSMMLSQQKSNYNDEQSNATMASSVQNMSPQRKIPPFTYDELPPSQSFTPPPLPPLPLRPNGIVNFKSAKSKHHKSAFISSSTSTSSSPHSTLSATIISNIANTTTPNNPKRKSTLAFEDACPSTPTSYTTCVCVTDVWEKQQRPSSLR